MNTILIFGTIFVVSLVLGFWSYSASILYDVQKDERKTYKNAPWQWKFFEIWNCFFNFFIGGLIGYYFVLVRLNPILKGENLNINDYVLFFIFVMCLFRWFPYLIMNFTQGINAIIQKFLNIK